MKYILCPTGKYCVQAKWNHFEFSVDNSNMAITNICSQNMYASGMNLAMNIFFVGSFFITFVHYYNYIFGHFTKQLEKFFLMLKDKLKCQF